MLNKIFKHGSGGASGVMNYMLREKDKVTPREGMTVLRGDVEIQAKLIDSLLPQFKQQYVSGCWSFEESPDQISQAQKDEIMDGTEQLMLAGLDPSRVSITWIEHTDKGRFELNYIVACIDLEHGRVFQPYVHSHDKARWNAFADMQNIKHGYTDPNDPAKARNLTEVDNLPRNTEDRKRSITSSLEDQIVKGFIKNRDDVKEALEMLGFPITREGKDYISVKNLDPKGRNIKLKSTTPNGLYDRDFDPLKRTATEVATASAAFKASANDRYIKAQAVFDKEMEHKAAYHNDRHSKPMLKDRPLNSELSDDRQADVRSDQSSNAVASRHHREPAPNARTARSGGSRFNDLVDRVVTGADAASARVADAFSELVGVDALIDKRVVAVGGSSITNDKILNQVAARASKLDDISDRHDTLREHFGRISTVTARNKQQRGELEQSIKVVTQQQAPKPRIITPVPDYIYLDSSYLENLARGIYSYHDKIINDAQDDDLSKIVDSKDRFFGGIKSYFDYVDSTLDDKKPTEQRLQDIDIAAKAMLDVIRNVDAIESKTAPTRSDAVIAYNATTRKVTSLSTPEPAPPSRDYNSPSPRF